MKKLIFPYYQKFVKIFEKEKNKISKVVRRIVDTGELRFSSLFWTCFEFHLTKEVKHVYLNHFSFYKKECRAI